MLQRIYKSLIKLTGLLKWVHWAIWVANFFNNFSSVLPSCVKVGDKSYSISCMWVVSFHPADGGAYSSFTTFQITTSVGYFQYCITVCIIKRNICIVFCLFVTHLKRSIKKRNCLAHYQGIKKSNLINWTYIATISSLNCFEFIRDVIVAIMSISFHLMALLEEYHFDHRRRTNMHKKTLVFLVWLLSSWRNKLNVTSRKLVELLRAYTYICPFLDTHVEFDMFCGMHIGDKLGGVSQFRAAYVIDCMKSI